MFGEQALGEALRVVQEMQGREVERVRRVLLLLLALDGGSGLLQVAGLLLRLLVDAGLVPQLGHVDVLVVTALVGGLLALLVAAKEEAHAAGNDLLVLAQRGQAHDLDCACVGPYLLLPQLACDLDCPDALWRLLVRFEQVVEHRLDRAVELVVRGLDVRRAQVGQDLGEEQLAQRLAGRRDEDGEERVEKRHRVDDILVAQQTQASDDLIAQLVLEDLVVLQEDLLEVFGKLRGEVRVQIGYVGDEFNKVLQVRKPGALRRGALQEQVAQRLVLLPLVVEVVAVTLRVALDLEPERGMIRLNLLEGANLALHCESVWRAVTVARVLECNPLAVSNFFWWTLHRRRLLLPTWSFGQNLKLRILSTPWSSIPLHPVGRAFPFLYTASFVFVRIVTAVYTRFSYLDTPRRVA